MSRPPRLRRMRQVVARSSYTRGVEAHPATGALTTPAGDVLHRFQAATALRPQWQLHDEHARAAQEALVVLAELDAERDDARRVAVEVDARIRTAVSQLRVAGASWGQIGAALGISRQGARQRFDAAARAADRTRRDLKVTTDSRRNTANGCA